MKKVDQRLQHITIVIDIRTSVQGMRALAIKYGGLGGGRMLKEQIY